MRCSVEFLAEAEFPGTELAVVIRESGGRCKAGSRKARSPSATVVAGAVLGSRSPEAQ